MAAGSSRAGRPSGARTTRPRRRRRREAAAPIAKPSAARSPSHEPSTTTASLSLLIGNAALAQDSGLHGRRAVPSAAISSSSPPAWPSPPASSRPRPAARRDSPRSRSRSLPRKAPSRKPSLASRSKASAVDDAACRRRRRGVNSTTSLVLAFDHGALHVELLLHRLGPLPGDLARLGEAEVVAAVDVDVGHGGVLREVIDVAAAASAARRSLERQGGEPPDLGVEAREVAALALEQALERRHQRRCSWRARRTTALLASREPAVVAGVAAPARRPSAPRSRRAVAASTAALPVALGGVARVARVERRELVAIARRERAEVGAARLARARTRRAPGRCSRARPSQRSRADLLDRARERFVERACRRARTRPGARARGRSAAPARLRDSR